MPVVFEVLRYASAASLGIFFGAMLTEGCLLVPYWQSISAGEFLAWYAVNGQRLLRFFEPVTTVPLLLMIATAALAWWDGHPSRWWVSLAAIIMTAIVGMFFLYFQKANASFAIASIGLDQVSAELIRWASWHWCRTGMSGMAFAASLVSLRQIHR
jgi:hypothetical protein